MDFLEKLDSLMALNGFNKSTLSAKSGIPYTTIDSFYKKGYDNVKLSTLTRLADALHTTLDYLVKDMPDALTPPEQRIGRAYGKASPPVKETVEVALKPWLDNDNTPTKKAPSKTEDAEFAEEFHVAIEEKEETDALPLYDITVAAGFGNYIDTDPQFELVDVMIADVPPGAEMLIRISGDSMEPDYCNGDIVFVESAVVLDSGEIGIFVVDGSAYCKQLIIPAPRKAVLRSLNEAYEDINLTDYTYCRTIGRVLGVWGK